jgi:hypothetical protein
MGTGKMFRTKILIQVNYKSGISMQFWVYKFTITDGEYRWESVNLNRPILLAIDEVESVWQLRVKKFGIY